MRLALAAANASIALSQLGLAPLWLRAPRRAAIDVAEATRLRGRRRRRRRFAAVVALVALTGVVVSFWPPRHGAMLVVMPPWVESAEAERRIAAAGGLALSAEDGDVAVFGLRLARMAIGADPDFAAAAAAEGALVLDAGPILWLDDKLAGVAAFFGRG